MVCFFEVQYHCHNRDACSNEHNQLIMLGLREDVLTGENEHRNI
jgi:hypothetical protein